MGYGHVNSVFLFPVFSFRWCPVAAFHPAPSRSLPIPAVDSSPRALPVSPSSPEGGQPEA